MALDHAALLEVLDTMKTGGAGERIRVAAETMYQALIDTELTSTIGADPWERTDTRTNQRNGSRPRTLSTNAGDLQLRIPKLRTGSFFPSLLDRRRRVDQALFAVVMEAYLHGVSTRKVDDLVQALGVASGISKSEVSRICADLDDQVAAFRGRSLAATTYPYVFLDATYCKARVDHQVVSQAVVVAIGVRADGHREVLGAGIQRCRVHFMRNVLAAVPKPNGEMVAALIRTIFAQPNAHAVREQLDTVAVMLGRQFPKVQAMLEGAKDDLLAFTAFPVGHWKKIWSTNPLERLNKEIKRRCDVVGVFPNPAALLRLSAAVLLEQHDEWLVSDRRYLSEGSMTGLTAIPAKNQALPSTALLTAS